MRTPDGGGGGALPDAPDGDVVTLRAGQLFDPVAAALVPRQTIRIHTPTGRILDVSPYDEDEDGARGRPDDNVIDLSGLTVLPGFVDAHVHLFLHPYAETSWQDQLIKESLAERTIRATVHARRTLLAGFTTVRDLGTEGADDADIGLRKCLSAGAPGVDPIIPGPRYFCASRAIVPTGSYGPKGVVHVDREGIDGVMGAEVADGRDGCVKAVRRQIGAGADWIKIYADYRVRSRMEGVSAETGRASINTFDDEELKALVSSAHMYGAKVAAHAIHGETIAKLVALGVDSIEHGYGILLAESSDAESDHPDPAEVTRERRRALHALAQSKTTWVPTLGAFYTLSHESAGAATWARASEAFKAALEEGVENIACGGDTGVFAHGQNALEMVLMVRLGADWRKVLRWGTLGGWACVRAMSWEGRQGAARLARLSEAAEAGWPGDHDVPFGAIRRGWAADVIATSGDVAGDFERAVSAESIQFVMKGGRVYKRDGKAVE